MKNTEDEFLNLYMCEFVREGESAFNLNILIGCGVTDTTTGKTGNLLLPARWGIVQVWIGYDANGSSGKQRQRRSVRGGSSGCSGGCFERVETRRVPGLEFEEQARVIEEFTYRY